MHAGVGQVDPERFPRGVMVGVVLPELEVVHEAAQTLCRAEHFVDLRLVAVDFGVRHAHRRGPADLQWTKVVFPGATPASGLGVGPKICIEGSISKTRENLFQPAKGTLGPSAKNEDLRLVGTNSCFPCDATL